MIPVATSAIALVKIETSLRWPNFVRQPTGLGGVPCVVVVIQSKSINLKLASSSSWHHGPWLIRRSNKRSSYDNTTTITLLHLGFPVRRRPRSCAWRRIIQSPSKLLSTPADNWAFNAVLAVAMVKCVTKAVCFIAVVIFFYGVFYSATRQLPNEQSRKVDSTALPVSPFKVVDSPERLLRHERMSDTKDLPDVKNENAKDSMKAPESLSSVKIQPSSKNTDSSNDKDMLENIAKLAVKVTSSVRGNLGPPKVVINEKSDDWLKD